MCLAVPAEVVAIEDGASARVRLGGVVKRVSIELTPDVAVGDYVVLHVGYALGVVDKAEAERTLVLLAKEAAA